MESQEIIEPVTGQIVVTHLSNNFVFSDTMALYATLQGSNYSSFHWPDLGMRCQGSGFRKREASRHGNHETLMTLL